MDSFIEATKTIALPGALVLCALVIAWAYVLGRIFR